MPILTETTEINGDKYTDRDDIIGRSKNNIYEKQQKLGTLGDN